MKATVEWQGEVRFSAVADSGHEVVMDGPPESGGRNAGSRPMELVLMGTGGCTAYDVVHILRKGRADVRGCRVEMNASRAESDPKVFTRIHMHFIVRGRDLKPEQVDRAIQLSAEKYCSASIMLAKTADISHDFEILHED